VADVRVSDDASAPRVWVLLGEGAGGNAQMCALAEALGWPFETLQLRYNRLNHVPSALLGPSVRTVDRERSDPLTPPWPDLVIAASRRSAPVARWIKAQSGGHTRLVHLLHAQAPLHHFDLIVTLPQFRLPDAPNVLHNTLPLNVLDQARLERAAQRWRPRLADLPRPWIAVLVGGDSSSYRLDPATARKLAQQAVDVAERHSGSLLVTTSKRTRADAAQALWQAIRGPSYRYAWQADDADNPYPAFLALADRFIVTADSASLPAEACATGRPVELFDWQPRAQPTGWARGAQTALAQRIGRGLIYWGAVKPRRDFAAFHRGLVERGLVGSDSPRGRVPDDMGRTVARIRALMQTAVSPSAGDRRSRNDSPCSNHSS